LSAFASCGHAANQGYAAVGHFLPPALQKSPRTPFAATAANSLGDSARRVVR
jgi:hypothetical protein